MAVLLVAGHGAQWFDGANIAVAVNVGKPSGPQFKLKAGARSTMRAITALSFLRILLTMACTCRSSSESLNRPKSLYTAKLLRLFRINAILYERDISFNK